MNIITKLLPFLGWFKDYSGGKFKIDLLAGITVALVLIPQSMAYAQLAGLPAYYGLYAAFLPPMVAALFGSSKQLATGPVAIVSLMSAASLEPLATAGSAEFIAYSIILALTVGIFQLSLGILRLGLVVNFLSHPVVNGFTNAAAIIIATSQLSKFFGVYVDKAEHHYETIIRVFQAALDYTHMPTLVFGIVAVIIMASLKKINPRIPNVLVAVALTTIVSYFIGFNDDAKIQMSQIKEPIVAEKIVLFNKTTLDIKELSDNRGVIAKQVDKLDNLSDEEKFETELIEDAAKIALHAEIDLLNATITELKGRANVLRGDLREMKFVGTGEGENRSYIFKLNASNQENDGKTWRLKLGNKVLNTDKLTVTAGGAVVGTIPEGLPTIAMPDLTLGSFLKLLPTAVIISLLGFMEAVAIAKAMAAQTGQKLDPNQELIGQGLANIVGSFGSSYAVSGSFSRSAVNLSAGAISGISSVVTSVVVIITLLFFTPLLYHLPQAVLAAVIMMAVIGLVNFKGFIHSWKAQWYDGAISIFCFLVTLYFAPHLDKGIMVGVALSMGVFLYKSMRPVVARLSLGDKDVLKNSDYYRLRGCKHISVVRFDGALFFANASYLEEQVAKFRNDQPDLRYILLDARGINDMDASGEEALEMLIKQLRSAGLGFAICSVKAQVINVLKRTGLYEKIGNDDIYADNARAVADIIKKVHTNTDLSEKGCKGCPLTKYLPMAK
ncbi:MAG: SulP family inorganic anion transporter [Desulfotalea sp.]